MALQAKALVASQWLAKVAKEGHGKMRILDTSWYLPKLRRNAKSEFKKKHVPGAAFFDIDQCCDKTSPLDHMLPSNMSSGKDVKLDLEAHACTETQTDRYLNDSASSNSHTVEGMMMNAESVAQKVDTEPGHIPGSISTPFNSFLSPTGHFLSREGLRGLFSRAGVDLSRPVCVSCGSAVTACHVALAAHACGHPGVPLYDGGWSEWYTRAAPEHVHSEGRGKRSWAG